MAGLGLSDALDSYQQGAQWKQQNDQIERHKAADKAATDVIESAKANWAMNGAQGNFTPDNTTMFKAAEARGQALAKAGDWNGFIQNEAQVQPMRIRTRAAALQQYQQDGDIGKLAQTVYPTIFDGKEIAKVEPLPGSTGPSQVGAPSGPGKLRFTLSDGTTQIMEPDKVVGLVKQSLIDPVAAAQKEIELNFLRTKNEIETGGKVKVEQAKGDQDRQTENTKAGFKTQQIGLENASREKMAEGNNKATLGAAGIHANAAMYGADVGADARITAAEMRADNAAKDPSTKRMTAMQLQDAVRKNFGALSMGLAGSSRNGDEKTAAIAAKANEIRTKDPSIPDDQAILQAAGQFGVKFPQPERTGQAHATGNGTTSAPSDFSTLWTK